MENNPLCKQCNEVMTRIYYAKSERELEFKGWYCHDCREWSEKEPPYTLDEKTGEKHLLNGH